MILLLLISCMLIFSYVVSLISYRYQEKQTIGKIVVFILLIIFSCFVTFTPDMAGYNIWLKFGHKGEILFSILRSIIIRNGLSYQELAFFYISVYSILLISFISKFKLNIFLVVLSFLLINFVFYTTQIRFFFAYFFGIYSLYYFHVNNKKVRALIFFIIGLLSHTAILLIIPFYFLYRLKIKSLIRNVIYISIGIFLLSIVLNSFLKSLLGDNLGKFGNYLNDDLVSSILGGLYFFTPSIIIMLILNYYYFRSGVVADKNNEFLYRISITSYIYIGIAFNIQVLGHRFIIPALLFQILLTFNIIKSKGDKVRSKHFFIFIIILIIYFCYFYFLPFWVFGHSNMWEDLKMILNSNTLFN